MYIYTHKYRIIHDFKLRDCLFFHSLGIFSSLLLQKSIYNVGTIPLLENWAMWLSIETLLA